MQGGALSKYCTSTTIQQKTMSQCNGVTVSHLRQLNNSVIVCCQDEELVLILEF